MLGAVTEATLRQPVYDEASRTHSSRLRRLLGLWLAVNVGGAIAWAIFLGGGGTIVARWLLASEYRAKAAVLLPSIALGYVFLLATQVVERMLYVHHRTSAVACVEGAAAALAVVGPAIGSMWFGLKGAAAAVPVYFGLQLVLAGIIAGQKREAGKSDADTA